VKILTNQILRKTGLFYELYTYKIPIEVGSSRLTTREKRPDLLPRDLSPEKRSIYAYKASCRAKQNLRRLTFGNMYNSPERLKFLTLTFKDNVTDYDYANYEWQKFRQRLNYFTGTKIEYVAVHEKQKRGAIHYHAILFNCPYIPQPKILDLWGNYVFIKEINKTQGTIFYLTKYLTKAFEDPDLRAKKRYFQNLTFQPYRTGNKQEIDLLLTPISCKPPLSVARYDMKNANGDTIQEIIKKEYVAI
jgi:hypothetical protein